MSIERYGKPGGENFPYLCEVITGKEIMIYAKTMTAALKEYTTHRYLEPHSIRQMSDNE